MKIMVGRKGEKNIFLQRKKNKASKARRKWQAEKDQKNKMNPVAVEVALQSSYTQEPDTILDITQCDSSEAYDTDLVLEHTDSIPGNNFPTGRVICDLGFVLTQARQLEQHSFECNFNGKMVFDKVHNRGLLHSYYFICNNKLCGHREKIDTDKEEKSLNHLAVLGAMSIGNGFSQEEQRFGTMNMSYMSRRTYAACEKIAGDIIDAQCKEKMEEAINKEIILAKDRGDVDKDGFYNICAIVDGGWCKRSYGHGYNSSSGVAVIISAETKKILFISVRNKVCLTCTAIADGRIPDKKHTCSKNWSGPSTAMESDIIIEGLKYLETVHNIRCTRLIADGDSNLMTAIQENVSYGGWAIKIECANHAVRRYFRALDRLQKNTHKFSGKQGIKARKILLERIPRLVKGAREAIKKNAVSNLSNAKGDNITNLVKELLNGPSHVFDNHKNCGTFCNKVVGDSDMSVFNLMKDTGMYSAILDEVRRVLISCCHTLVYNLTNNPAEIYMSQLSKTIGGKRIDFSKGGSVKRRANIAALAFQSPGQKWQHSVNKAMTGRSPGTPLRKFLRRRLNMYLKQGMRRKLFAVKKRPRKRIHVPRGGDENYGDEPVVPDLCPEIIALKTAEHLSSIAVQSNDELEERTREQSNCEIWLYERSKRIPSTMFKDVSERRMTTLSANLVKRIVYREKISTKALEYGRANESIAMKAYEAYKSVSVQRCGMFIDPENPFLCTSPDGLIGTEGLVEIKCPHTAKDSSSLVEVCKTHNIGLKVNDGSLYLPRTHKYYYQIQGQLSITNRKWCDLFVWSPKDFYCTHIDRDVAFWDRIVPKLKQFYMDCCVPEFVDSRARRKLPLREPAYILTAVQKRDEERAKKREQKEIKAGNIEKPINVHDENEKFAEFYSSVAISARRKTAKMKHKRRKLFHTEEEYSVTKDLSKMESPLAVPFEEKEEENGSSVAKRPKRIPKPKKMFDL